jgi:hypothetical protein
LVAIGPVVSEEKIFMWIQDGHHSRTEFNIGPYGKFP